MKDHSFTNALIHESSPYLLQHAHNPVNWEPWGEAAWARAKAENKLVIVSVGYAACHWCHVMERESFEDILVAESMNQHFVCIKVDREERPDVDQIYMDAVQLMTGAGGWPLNCVALPDGRPIWGGTYFPKHRWMSILSQLHDLWTGRRSEAIHYAEQILEAIKGMEDVEIAGDEVFLPEDLEAILLPWRKTFDRLNGGPNRAPKFPLPNNYSFLMQAEHFTQDQSLADAVDLTLQKMAWGGIYDQLGGGFARYSVDAQWMVPHFEKMTYDNGQLVSLYADAWKRKPLPLYKRLIEQTLAWVSREMTSVEGGFYSALDADSEGVEGKFYVWRKNEIDEILGEDSDWFCSFYQITRNGNWEHGNNILMMHMSPENAASQSGTSVDEFLAKLDAARGKLLNTRGKRVRPGLDDKILSSWNAIMLKGYADAFRALGNPTYLDAALRNASFIESKLRDGNRLNRTYKDGKATINAFLDDYALLAEAYISLYYSTLDQDWLIRADGLVQYAMEHFLDKERRMFFYTSDLDPKLITRKLEILDNVIPSSNSVMAHVLHLLGHLLDKPDYTALSEQMLQNVRKDMPRYGSGYSNWAALMLRHIFPVHEVVVAGPDAKHISREIDSHFLPNVILAGAAAEAEGQIPHLKHRFSDRLTRIFVCKQKSCLLPVTNPEDALRQINADLK